MYKVVTGIFGLFLAGIFALGLFDADILSFTKEDNESTLENSATSALQSSVKLGSLRVNEEIEINTSEASQVFYDEYDNTYSFQDKEANRAVNVDYISEKAPYMAITGTADSMSYLNNIDRDIYDRSPMSSSQKYILIYEAKSKTKKLGGNTDER